IMRLVAEAQASNSRAQVLADRAAAWLFFVALGAGVVTLAAWLAIGKPEEALIRTATVLVIACPHALGLAIPLVIAISTTLAARAAGADGERFRCPGRRWRSGNRRRPRRRGRGITNSHRLGPDRPGAEAQRGLGRGRTDRALRGRRWPTARRVGG